MGHVPYGMPSKGLICGIAITISLIVMMLGSVHAQPSVLANQPQVTVESILNLTRAERDARSRYHSTRTKLAVAAELWLLVGVTGLVLLNIGPRIWKRTERFRWTAIRTSLISLALLALIALWTLPIRYISYSIELNWGFVHHPLSTWFLDRGTDFLFELTAIPIILAAFALLKRSPKRWWIWLWAASIPYQFVMIILWPVLVVPAYNKLNPMPESRLRESILRLSERAGAKSPDIFVVDISKRTKRLNAYMAGLGPTKRIVYWDTTLKSLNERQILAITGHELGHYVLGHVWWKWGEGALGALIALWLLSRILPAFIRRFGTRLQVDGIDNPSSLAVWLLAIHIFLFLQSPIESALSRIHEREADQFGIALTGDGLGAAEVFAAFVKHDFSDPSPSPWIVWWWYSHPPSSERISSALKQIPPSPQ